MEEDGEMVLEARGVSAGVKREGRLDRVFTVAKLCWNTGRSTVERSTRATFLSLIHHEVRTIALCTGERFWSEFAINVPANVSSLLTLKETCRSLSLARSSYAQYNYFLLEKVFFDASLSKHGIVASRGTTRKRARVNNSRDSKARGIFALIRKILKKKESWDRLTLEEKSNHSRD